MRSQLTDYGLGFNKIPMYCDNKSAIALCWQTYVPTFSIEQQIDIIFHFISRASGKWSSESLLCQHGFYCQQADIFTKPLRKERIEFLKCNKAGNANFYPGLKTLETVGI
ncbi:hypothetical protein Tco_0030803 [Tanacetum coccineum]